MAVTGVAQTPGMDRSQVGGEAPGEWLRAACLRELQEACDWLGDRSRKRDRAVHEARKCLRRVRAWLRLLKPSRRRALAEVDGRLRSLRKLIGPLRDAASRIEASEALLKRRNLGPLRPAVKHLHAHLLRRLDAGWKRQPRRGRRYLRLLAGLDEMIAGIPEWPLANVGWRELERGWVRAHQRACSGRRRCKGRIGASLRHDWRRRVRVLLLQGQLLEAHARPQELAALKELSQSLGDENDLALMTTCIRSAGLEENQARALRDWLLRHRRELATRNDRRAQRLLRRGDRPGLG